MHYCIKEHNNNQNMHFSTFPIQKPKIGQGQPRVIIYINLKEITPQMLYTKFQGNWPSGSGEEDF